MTTRTLNKLTLRQAQTAGDGSHTDGGGLRLEVADDSKRRSWIFRFTSPVLLSTSEKHPGAHMVREMGLGRAAGPSGDDGVTLKEARQERDRLRVMLRDGIDPLEARKAAGEDQRRKAQEEAGKKTVRATAEAYIDQKRHEWGASSVASWRRFAERGIGPIAALPIDSIGLAEIKRAVMPLIDAGLIPAALSAQTRLQALLDYAAEHGWRSEDKRSRFSRIAPKPRKGEAPNRHPALNPDRDADAIRAVVTRLRASPTMSAMALEFIILTAVRVSEATGATWDEIDLDKALWVIPAARMKMGREHQVPLSDRALAILKALHEHRGRNRHVFPGVHPGKPTARSTVFDTAQQVSGGKASVHGWRATFRSWCSETGVAFEVAELSLAHGKDKIVAAYDRAQMIERRRVVLQDWANWLSGPATATVIPLRRA